LRDNLKKPDDPQPRRRVAIAIELDHAVPWHYECYQGILHYGAEQDWLCVVDPYLVGMTGRSGIGDYDGVVGRINAEVAEACIANSIPVVNHWQNSPAVDLPSVNFDYREAAHLAGIHLMMSGYQKFAYIGITGDLVGESGYEGLSSAVGSKGFEKPDFMDFPYNFEAEREGVIRMRRALTKWLGRITPPLGVFVQASHAARYLAQICSEMGMSVPHDVGIVLFLGDTIIATSASPTISAVDLDYFGLGYESAAMLDRLMRAEPVEQNRKLIVPKRIVVRESSDIFLSSDPMVTDAMHYIAENNTSIMRVEDVAKYLKTSRRTLERRFQEVLHRSVYSEISRLRAEHIKRILVESDRPLAEIAEACGFSSDSHFTRFFRNVVGTTPSRFRKQQQHES